MHEVTVHTKVKYKQCRLLQALSYLPPRVLFEWFVLNIHVIIILHFLHHLDDFSHYIPDYLSLAFSTYSAHILHPLGASTFSTSSAFSLMHLPPADQTEIPSNFRYIPLTDDIRLFYRLMPPSAELTCEIV